MGDFPPIRPYAPQFNHCPLCWKVFLYGNFIAQEKRKPKKRSKNLLQILSATKHSDNWQVLEPRYLNKCNTVGFCCSLFHESWFLFLVNLHSLYFYWSFYYYYYFFTKTLWLCITKIQCRCNLEIEKWKGQVQFANILFHQLVDVYTPWISSPAALGP